MSHNQTEAINTGPSEPHCQEQQKGISARSPEGFGERGGTVPVEPLEHHFHPLVTPFNHNTLIKQLALTHHDKESMQQQTSSRSGGKRPADTVQYRPKSHRNQAAVMLPIITSPSSHPTTSSPPVPYLLLTQRSSSLRSHRAQVAFPGGKMDETDENLWKTALRECHEEIGLKEDNIEFLGELDPFMSRNGLLVAPYVGLIRKDYEVVLDPGEVDCVFKVPLAWFLKRGQELEQVEEIMEREHEHKQQQSGNDQHKQNDFTRKLDDSPKSSQQQSASSIRRSLIMEGFLYKTHHYVSASETSPSHSRSLLSMYHPEPREFKIWGFSLGVLIRLFQRGWNVKHDVWGKHFDVEAYEMWMKKSGEMRRKEREG
eukprot:CAMPEP_0117445998 /NCGR_PEP_ID=MMETSP0759-20121206/6099_1 /TAXON_ID=63605 /ORGANISM="Percolomonas cosmopolitus, Strain WS" /LENGTH=370 /DNA_ID=CAMNT_0005238221 /DNA_START=152 /DNA_END=1264 /DNA_ORIENTATION=-